MRLLRCDRHPDVEAVATFEIEEFKQLTEEERRASLASPGTRKMGRKLRLDLCAECSDEFDDVFGFRSEVTA